MSNEGEFGFFWRGNEGTAFARRLFMDKDKVLVFHNAKFDLRRFMIEGIPIFNCKAQIECTLILSKLLNENWQHDLRYLAYRYCGRDTIDKDEIKTWINQNRRAFQKEQGRPPGFQDAPRPILKKRIYWDIESTILLWHFLHPRIMKTSAQLYKTEIELMFVCIDMECEGVLVDVTRAKKLRNEALAAVEKIKDDLDELVRGFKCKKKKKGEYIEIEPDEFNPGSNAHLEGAFRHLGIELKYKSKGKKNPDGSFSPGKNWSFDEYAMIRYADKRLVPIMREASEEGWPADRFYETIHRTIREQDIPRWNLLPALILKYREMSKMVSTYYNHLIHDVVDVYVDEKGREIGTLHCRFNQSEAMTGRFSCSEPNLQNMPRILGPRECFIPRKGYWNWHFDYDQVEMKLFVHFAKDEKMARAIEGDIHQFTASEVYGVPFDKVTKEQRKRAKGVNFGIIYGAGAPTMAETLTKKGLPTAKSEASTLVANYHRRFPSVHRATTELKIQLHRHGFVANPFGRRYHIPTKFGYKALNYMCQGTSADIMKEAMVRIWKWLRAGGFKSKIIMTIHDEIVVQIYMPERRKIVPHIIRMMENKKDYFVPITADAEVVRTRWSNKEDLEIVGYKK